MLGENFRIFLLYFPEFSVLLEIDLFFFSLSFFCFPEFLLDRKLKQNQG